MIIYGWCSRLVYILYGAETSFANKPKDDTVAEAYSLTWLMWGLRSPSRPTKDSSPMPPHVRDHSTDEYLAQGLFFREEAVQVGKTITLYFPLAASAPLGLLPRHVADSIPFSTSSLPSALARLGVARNSVQAANMEETLYMCGLPPKAGEAKFCATSLEALVEGSMAALGTRNIRPMTSDLPAQGHLSNHTPYELYTRWMGRASCHATTITTRTPSTCAITRPRRGRTWWSWRVPVVALSSLLPRFVTLTRPTGTPSISPSRSSAPSLAPDQSATICRMGTTCGSRRRQIARHPKKLHSVVPAKIESLCCLCVYIAIFNLHVPCCFSYVPANCCRLYSLSSDQSMVHHM